MLCVWKEAAGDLYLDSFKFGDFPPKFRCGLCGSHSACLVIPSGVSVAASFFYALIFCHWKKCLVAGQRDTYYQFIGDVLVMIFDILPVCILCVFSHSDVKHDNVKIEGLVKITVSERDYRSVYNHICQVT